MLFQPDAHEALADETWNTERARTAIASIVADAEGAFGDGWPTHPRDIVEEGDATTRLRTGYLGGAGVVDALHRLARLRRVATRPCSITSAFARSPARLP
jgi:hypothetical protein